MKVVQEKKVRFRDRIQSKKIKKALILSAEIIVTLFLSAVFAFAFCSSTTIQEVSMDPTIKAGSVTLINRAAYLFSDVKRGDLIAYANVNSTDEATHIKRVIGLPGETIQIRDGLIFIDGQTYMEDKDLPVIVVGGLAEEGVTLGNGEYFVLGDNRNNSEDSRFSDVGNIAKSNIIGKVWFITAPSSDFGFV